MKPELGTNGAVIYIFEKLIGVGKVSLCSMRILESRRVIEKDVN